MELAKIANMANNEKLFDVPHGHRPWLKQA